MTEPKKGAEKRKHSSPLSKPPSLPSLPPKRQSITEPATPALSLTQHQQHQHQQHQQQQHQQHQQMLQSLHSGPPPPFKSQATTAHPIPECPIPQQHQKSQTQPLVHESQSEPLVHQKCQSQSQSQPLVHQKSQSQSQPLAHKSQSQPLQSGTAHLLQIPFKLCMNILRHLSAEDLAACARTCTHLCKAASDDRLWHRLYCFRWGAGSEKPKSVRNGGTQKQSTWKQLYFEHDEVDMVELLRDVPLHLRPTYVQMRSSKRYTAPGPDVGALIDSGESGGDGTPLDKRRGCLWTTISGGDGTPLENHLCRGQHHLHHQIGNEHQCGGACRAHESRDRRDAGAVGRANNGGACVEMDAQCELPSNVPAALRRMHEEMVQHHTKMQALQKASLEMITREAVVHGGPSSTPTTTPSSPYVRSGSGSMSELCAPAKNPNVMSPDVIASLRAPYSTPTITPTSAHAVPNDLSGPPVVSPDLRVPSSTPTSTPTPTSTSPHGISPDLIASALSGALAADPNLQASTPRLAAIVAAAIAAATSVHTTPRVPSHEPTPTSVPGAHPLASTPGPHMQSHHPTPASISHNPIPASVSHHPTPASISHHPTPASVPPVQPPTSSSSPQMGSLTSTPTSIAPAQLNASTLGPHVQPEYNMCASIFPPQIPAPCLVPCLSQSPNHSEEDMDPSNASPSKPGRDEETPNEIPSNPGQDEEIPQVELLKGLRFIREFWVEFTEGLNGAPPISELVAKYGTKWRHPNVKRSEYGDHAIYWFAIVQVAKEMGVSNSCSARWWCDYQEWNSLTLWQVRRDIKEVNTRVAEHTQKTRGKRRDIPEYGQLYTCMIWRSIPISARHSDKRTPYDIDDIETCTKKCC